jgi:hypothetical protein
VSDTSESIITVVDGIVTVQSKSGKESRTVKDAEKTNPLASKGLDNIRKEINKTTLAASTKNILKAMLLETADLRREVDDLKSQINKP